MISQLSSSDASFLRNLNKIQERSTRAQLELSSGKRIFDASDDPDSLSALLSSRADLETNAQLKINLGRTKSEVDSAETALQKAVSVLERARVLGGQGRSSFNSKNTNDALRLEVSDLVQQVLNVSNTAIDGRYVFAGNNDEVQPFSFDPPTNTVGPYAGTIATRQSLYPGGTPFDVARSGVDVFQNDDPTKNVFASLTALRDALLDTGEGLDQGVLQDSLVNLESAAKHLSDELIFYGNAQRRITEATTETTSKELRLRTEISRLEDADATEAIIEMQQASFNQTVALQVRGQRSKDSLFNYLR
jgi:flagellar hook-associated protein 3 FlgL